MITTVLTLISIALFVFLFFKWSTGNPNVFGKQGLKYVKPLPFIGTSYYIFEKRGLLDHVIDTYNKFSTEKVVGLFEFGTPLYFIRSPEIIQHITVKDFAHFQDRQNTVDKSVDELLGNCIFSMKGQEWRDMRSALSPMFTGSKMKMMFPLILDTSKQLIDHLNEDYKKNDLTAYEMKDVFSRYSNDVIATCAFGVSINSFTNKDNEIYQVGQQMQMFQKLSFILKFFCMKFFPQLTKLIGINFIDKKSQKIFDDLILNTMEVRKREGIVRPDMIQLLMKLKEDQLSNTFCNKTEDDECENNIQSSDEKRVWTDSELLAQSFIFFLSGFDTTSGFMIFVAYELAVNPDIQSKLIKEIDDIDERLSNTSVTYDELEKMKYLDMVISETLRKWPPGITIDRKCVKTYNYEDETGFKFTIEKDSIVWLPVYGLHTDPKYYTNPEKFDPERFSDENKANIDMKTYLPFGVGPRRCMGIRFALMEIKILFYSLLLNYRLNICKETQVPIKLKKTIFSLLPEKEIKLYFEPRRDKVNKK